MAFSFGGLISAVVGAVAKVANAVVNALSPVAKSGGIVGGIAGAAVGVAEAVLGATAEFADVCEDGEIDDEEAEELLEDVFKLLVGAFIVNFGSDPLDSNNGNNGDNIVISGNYVSEDGKYVKRSFVETAVKRIKDLKNQGKDDITWIVADSGYNEKDKTKIQNFALENGVKVMFISDTQQLADYINKGENPNGEIIEDRKENKISTVTVFAHGSYLEYDNEFKLALGYKDEEKPNLNISSNDLENISIDNEAFSSDSETWFESCNTGTVTEKSKDNKSFAQEWADETGSKTIALADGRTDYQDINKRDNWMDNKIWLMEDRFRRRLKNEEFTIDGCENYPIKSSEYGSENSQWKIYKVGEESKDIDESQIKEELGE
ncbi:MULTISPECIES: hypothetical protein [unclassified Clostridium]|uniref:hypothetical protein n=3 Tax=unclassified Clostridium TaxID=2614128 RepID=UPI002079F6D9|nr:MULTISPECIES: hypothetical protein [unclassified Clostridium]